MPNNSYTFEESWFIPARAADIWQVLADTSLLPIWWRGAYLAAVPVDAADPIRVGKRMRVRARGALPYTLNFMLETTALEPDQVFEVRTEGDFIGVWRATLREQPAGTEVGIDWRVTVEKPIVRFLSPLLKPLFAWNHRWTTPRGEAGLRAYLGERGKLYPGAPFGWLPEPDRLPYPLIGAGVAVALFAGWRLVRSR